MERLNQENEAWIRKIQDKLEHYADPLPVDGWEQVQSRMRKQVYMPLWRKWAVAATVFVASVAGISYYFLQSDTAQTVRTLALLPNPEPWTLPANIPLRSAEPVRDITAVVQNPIHHHTPQQAAEPKLPEDSKTVVEVQSVVEQPDNTTTDRIEQTKEQDNPAQTQRTTDTQPYTPPGAYSSHRPTSKPARTARRNWSVGISVRSGMHNNNLGPRGDASYDDYYMMSDAALPNFSPEDGLADLAPGKDFLVVDGEVVVNGNYINVPKSRHKQPVSFGLSVRKSLYNNLALESGLVYTLLSSEIGVQGGYIDQKLHYIGLPLKLVYDFTQRSRFHFYVSGGGMVEKCIYGKLNSKRLSVKSVDLSLHGGVGVQYDIMPHVGLYAEPGISYYTNTSADIETIRSERPLNLTLQAGVRFSY